MCPQHLEKEESKMTEDLPRDDEDDSIERSSDHLKDVPDEDLERLLNRIRRLEEEDEAETGAASPPSFALPEEIAGYRIRRLLGRGGMGLVYLAEQDNPRRAVALKVLREDIITARMLRRFEFEASALARLEHPAIARIYEAGTAAMPQGTRPFFAMELVQGLPITEWVAGRSLSLRGRIELFVRLCHGVQYAHDKGVLHRDLKPSNVLVGEDGQPRILDFGVARPLEPEDSSESSLTLAGQRVGTLAYMSPEQWTARADDVDTRSDVYSLGLLLYELLAGRRPYEVEGLPLPAAVRIVCESVPAPLGRVDRGLRGDVEIIAAKALEKEPGRRYGSVREIAADLERWLRGEPIVARAASTLYILGKLVRRHRPVVAGLATALVAVIATLLVVVVSRSAVQAAAERATNHLEVAGEMLIAIGNRWLGTGGDLGKTEEDAELARQIRSRALEIWTSEDPRTYALVHNLATRLDEGGLLQDAEELYRDALEGRSRLLGEDSDEALQTMGNLGNALAMRIEKREEARALLDKVWRILRERHGESDPRTIGARSDLQLLEVGLFPTEANLQALRETYEDRRRVRGPSHAETLDSMLNLADALSFARELDEASELASEALLELVEGNGEPRAAARALHVLGIVAVSREQTDPDALRQALVCLEAARLGQKRSSLASEQVAIATAISLAVTLTHMRRFEWAERVVDEAVKKCIDFYGNEGAETCRALNGRAELYYRQGRFEHALREYREVLDLRRRIPGVPKAELIGTLVTVAALEIEAGNLTEAERLLLEATTSRFCIENPQDERTIVARNSNVELLIKRGEYERALEEASALVQFAEERGQVAGEHYATFLFNRGLALLRLRDWAGAIADLESCANWFLDPRRGGDSKARSLLGYLVEATIGLGDGARVEKYQRRLENWDRTHGDR